MSEKLDVDKVEKVIKNVVDVILQVEKSKADDGKISKVELLAFGDEAIALAKDVANYRVIKAQILDIDRDEGKALIAYVTSLGIVPEYVQLLITHVFSAIEKSIGIYQDDIIPIINIIKNLKK